MSMKKISQIIEDGMSRYSKGKGKNNGVSKQKKLKRMKGRKGLSDGHNKHFIGSVTTTII